MSAERIGPYSTLADVVWIVLVTLFTDRGATPFFLLNIFVISSVRPTPAALQPTAGRGDHLSTGLGHQDRSAEVAWGLAPGRSVGLPALSVRK